MGKTLRRDLRSPLREYKSHYFKKSKKFKELKNLESNKNRKNPRCEDDNLSEDFFLDTEV